LPLSSYVLYWNKKQIHCYKELDKTSNLKSSYAPHNPFPEDQQELPEKDAVL